MVDHKLDVISAKKVFKFVEGEEIENGGKYYVYVSFSSEIEDVQWMDVRIRHFIDVGC